MYPSMVRLAIYGYGTYMYLTTWVSDLGGGALVVERGHDWAVHGLRD